jgi:ComF family protein
MSPEVLQKDKNLPEADSPYQRVPVGVPLTETEGLKNKSVLQSLLDLIYPPYCLRCYKSLIHQPNKFICPECLKSASEKRTDLQNICLKCGMFLGPHSGQKLDCPSCRTMRLTFKRNLAFGSYDGVLKDLILIYKYGREKVLSETLAKWLVERLTPEKDIISQINLIVPVPLTKSRQKKRGFNQSELLALYLSKQFFIPVSRNNLIRIKETPAQASLSRAERIQNLRDAFEVRKPAEFKDKNILLIDDVLTTGATADEISRLLKQAGAHSVHTLVLAR